MTGSPKEVGGLVVLVDTLVGQTTPRIIPYGKSTRIEITSDDESFDKSGNFHKYQALREKIGNDFDENARGGEIILALRDAVCNFEEHRNHNDHDLYLKVWPWQTSCHLCFAINGEGAPNYNFDPRKLEIDRSPQEMIKRGWGHTLMAKYANFLAYDEHKGMLLYFNLPKENWLS